MLGRRVFLEVGLNMELHCYFRVCIHCPTDLDNSFVHFFFFFLNSGEVVGGCLSSKNL